MTIGASDPEHRWSSNLQLEEDPPDDLRFFAPARQRVACEAVPEHPVSQTGDLWLLGAKVTCPNCRKATPLERAIKR